MRNSGLSRSWRVWYEMCLEVITKRTAEKAVMGWKQGGLKKGWNSWMELLKALCERTAKRAVASWKQKGFRSASAVGLSSTRRPDGGSRRQGRSLYAQLGSLA